MEKLTGYASIDKPWLKYYPKYIIDADIPKMTMYEYLLEANNYYPNRIALNYFDKKISYGELIEKIDITALSLMQMGIKKGDIITICLPTVPEFIYLFYAISKIGAVANMIDPRKSTEEMIEYSSSVKSKLFIVVDTVLNKIKNLKENTDIEFIVAISPADSMPKKMQKLYNLKNGFKKKKKDIIYWDDFYQLGIERKHNIIKEDFPKYEENTPVAIVYTGGTTGKSKGVILSNDNINATAYQTLTCGYLFERKHVWLNIMPPFIAYGIGNGLHLPLICGMEMIVVPAFDPNKFDRLLQKYHPNHMTGVPTHYDSIVNSKILKKESLNYIMSAIVGGDKLDETRENIINKYFFEHCCDFKISKGYGMSEVAAAVCAAGIDSENEIGSVGIPFHHITMAIFDPETNEELKYGEVGELCITGPNTMVGYYNNEEETNKIIRVHKDGLKWVHSGDYAYITENGKVFIKGRIKEMIIRHDGFKVFPIAIEEAICADVNVNTCKVVGIKDKNHSQGELPKAYVVLKENRINKEEIKKQLLKECEEKLAEYMQPVDIVFIDKLPLTKIGKIDFMKLKEYN